MIATIFFNLTIFSFLANNLIFFLILGKISPNFSYHKKLELSPIATLATSLFLKIGAISLFHLKKIEVFSKVSIVRSEEKEKTNKKNCPITNIWFSVS
jgi:hypothetical protein